MAKTVTASPGPGVLIHDGKPYATGLLWFTVQEEAGKDLLKSRTAKTRADFYCQRTHVSQQQGFGWLDKGHRRGMPAAAAMVADQLVGEWHGVFEADNGWWYVQVRSDTITPNGDQFFTTEEEAFNLFQEEMKLHNWPHAYAPDKWHINDGNTREVSLKTLLGDLAFTKLESANMTAAFGGAKQRNVAIAAIAILVLLMLGAVLYSLLSEPDLSIPPPKTAVAPRTVKPVLAAPGAVNGFLSPQQVLAQCSKAASQLTTSIPGWTMQSFVCSYTATGGRATLGWKQAGGTLTQAKEQGLAVWPQTASVTVKNDVMSAGLALEKLPLLQPEKLASQESALLMLEQTLQPLGALQIKPVVAAAPVKKAKSSVMGFGSKPAPPEPPQPKPYLDITFISGFDPARIAPHLVSPGLELTNVEWTVPRGVWQYKFKWTYDKPTEAKPAAPDSANVPAAAGKARPAATTAPGGPS